MILLLLIAVALAATPFDGERLRWEVRYRGVSAGEAWSEARADPLGTVFEAGCNNAPWYAPIYTLDDRVWSTYSPTRGSLRYQTRFREGGFHQDQDMQLMPDRVLVWRHQRMDGAWKEWTDTYGASPGALDPVSALYVLREATGAGPWSWPVWTGKKTVALTAESRGQVSLETLFGTLEVDLVALTVPHKGEVEQRGGFLVYLTRDARRAPVRAELRSSVGSFRADLVGYRAPSGASWGALYAADR